MGATQFKLLYVCNGNNARSPLAAACTSELLATAGQAADDVHWQVASAGTHAVDGDPVRADAVRAAGELNLDISSHQPSLLTADQCGDPNLILAMSWEQVSHIWSLVPKAWDRVFTIKEFVHWAQRAPVRPPILFPDRMSEMRDKIIQTHAIRKRARADYGFWGGIRPQDLNLIEPNGKGEDAWTALAKAVHALVSDVIMLLRGPEHQEAQPIAPAVSKKHRPRPRRSTARAKARR